MIHSISTMIKYIKDTIKTYPGDPDGLEWSTEDVQALISECERLERLYDLELGRSNKAENQYFKAIQELVEVKAKVKELETEVKNLKESRDFWNNAYKGNVKD